MQIILEYPKIMSRNLTVDSLPYNKTMIRV